MIGAQVSGVSPIAQCFREAARDSLSLLPKGYKVERSDPDFLVLRRRPIRGRLEQQG
jgi:hypothetical protein